MQPSTQPSRRILYEISALLLITLAAPLLWPELRTLFVLMPLVYFLIERPLRGRTWREVGFDLRTLPRGVVDNWFLILLVAVVIQFLVVWGAAVWFPAFLEHVKARLPFTLDQAVGLLPLVLLATLGEEISYRALFQARLSWFIPTPAAIVLVSVAFGLAHWAAGDPVIVMADILLIIIDSIIYGVIFARSKNVFVAWIAHFLADLFGLSFLLLL
jgi:uncharacterized protein